MSNLPPIPSSGPGQPERGAPSAGWGLPRVFSVTARALPVTPPAGVRSIAREREVALRMTPSPGDAFAMRAERGAFADGMLFALRYLEGGGAKVGLVRVVGVTEIAGVGFDLVEARLVQRADPTPSRRSARTPIAMPFRARVVDPIGVEGDITATLVDLSESGIGFLTDDAIDVGWTLEITSETGTIAAAQVEVVRRGPAGSRRFGGRFVDAERGRRVFTAAAAHPAAATAADDATDAPRPSVSASATSVSVGGVLTIGQETSVTLASPVLHGRHVALVAPRGQVPTGACFAVRYLTQGGAMRALVRADVVSPQPGMVDGIEATLLRPPTPAPERAHHRTAFDRFFTGDLGTGATVTGRLLDLSAGGVGFRLNRGLAVGDRLRFVDKGLGDLDGAESIVVRRDPRDPQRFGARFVEPERGAHVLETILDLDRAAREHRRQVDAKTARHRGAAAMQPLTESDVRRIRSQRMRIREPGTP